MHGASRALTATRQSIKLSNDSKDRIGVALWYGLATVETSHLERKCHLNEDLH
jgi:hypothetical protein